MSALRGKADISFRSAIGQKRTLDYIVPRRDNRELTKALEYAKFALN